MTTLTDAYHRGYDAALDGKDPSDNPFTADSSGPQWGRWKSGWTDASSNTPPRHSSRKITVASLFEGGTTR